MCEIDPVLEGISLYVSDDQESATAIQEMEQAGLKFSVFREAHGTNGHASGEYPFLLSMMGDFPGINSVRRYILLADWWRRQHSSA